MKFCVNRNEKDTIKCHVASIEDMAKAKERIGEISLSIKKVKKKNHWQGGKDSRRKVIKMEEVQIS